MDVNTQTFSEVFAAYTDDDTEQKGKPGFGLDDGGNFWLQYGCLDINNKDCMFLSTNRGDCVHLDTRVGKGKENGECIWKWQLHGKKVNTIVAAPQSHTVVSAGLDACVQLWDLRAFSSSKGKGSKKPKPFATCRSSKTVSSAFLSPSGKTM